MNKERAIPFRDWEVLATLDGRKTVFRRPMRRQPAYHCNDWTMAAEPGDVVMYRGWPTRLVESRGRHKRDAGELTPQKIRCPYGVPGDTLRVQEAHIWERSSIGLGVRYRADGALLETDETIYADTVPTGRWRPSTQMPAWASRIRMRVVSVGAERVQDVTDGAAAAEGCWSDPDDGPLPMAQRFYPQLQSAANLSVFRERWIDRYGKESWNRNDWVWRVEFERIEP